MSARQRIGQRDRAGVERPGFEQVGADESVGDRFVDNRARRAARAGADVDAIFAQPRRSRVRRAAHASGCARSRGCARFPRSGRLRSRYRSARDGGVARQPSASFRRFRPSAARMRSTSHRPRRCRARARDARAAQRDRLARCGRCSGAYGFDDRTDLAAGRIDDQLRGAFDRAARQFGDRRHARNGAPRRCACRACARGPRSPPARNARLRETRSRVAVVTRVDSRPSRRRARPARRHR